MDKYFKLETGERINIIEHTVEQIEKWPNLTIRIGTDSQNYSANTIYVTSIVYRYGNRGAHAIHYKEQVPRIRVDYTRLYEEGIRTIQIHDVLTGELPVSVEACEFDYADIKRTVSSQLVSVFKNWGGINAVFKSGQMIACKYSDHICRI